MIRPARQSDLTRLTEIYNYEIEHGTATFDIRPFTPEERLSWLEAHRDKYRLIVWEDNGSAAGYASFSPFNPKAAYAGCVELSLYIAPQYRGKGIGRALLCDMLAFAKERDDIHTVISLITAGNTVSEHLHSALGFEKTGTLYKVGRKFGKLLDVHIYQIIVK